MDYSLKITRDLTNKLLKIRSIRLFEEFDFITINTYLKENEIFGVIGRNNRDNGNFSSDIDIDFYFSMPFEDEKKIDEEIQAHQISDRLEIFDNEMKGLFKILDIFKAGKKYEGHPWQKVKLLTTYSISEDSI